ncbi:MAG: hypothetical protein NTV87_02980 [Ignavibacteriae bacterium]|nr:hypothetical protein [Ignavibacteriota bacterium]
MKPEYRKQIQKFIELGLTEREAKVYITLLSKKGFTTLELQNSVEIPRTKVYEVIKRMLVRGICTERGKDECEEELKKRKALKESVTSIFSPLFNENKDNQYSIDFVEVFNDKEQIQNKYLQALKDTKLSLLTFNKGPYVCDNSDRLKAQAREESKVIKRGALCKNIFEAGELQGQDWLLKYVRNQSKLGQQARVTASLPIKMVVFDEMKVLFPLLRTSGETNSISMIFIEHRELAVACKMLFSFIWENSEPVK